MSTPKTTTIDTMWSADSLNSRFDILEKDDFSENRKQALLRFNELGFPTKKNEEWKYTDISGILKLDINSLDGISKLIISEKDLVAKVPFASHFTRLVFVNGVYQKALSSIDTGNDKIKLDCFSSGLINHSSLFKEKYTQLAPAQEEAFTALNTAFGKEGAFLHIPDNTELKDPICFIFLTKNEKGTIFSQPRNLITIGNHSSASIIEMHASLDESISFTNSVSEIFVGENSSLDYYKIEDRNEQSFHIDGTYASQEKSSHLTSTNITSGGKLVRNKLGITLNGEHCETHMNGLYFGSSSNHIDNHTMVDHAKPNCYSNELYKGVMNDKSTSVFSGKILVRKDAQKTNAFQSNKNILLSDEATVNSKPQLEIFADDVKCSHGATTGQLNEEALFYLQARGIGEDKAKALLMYAFANEIIERVKINSLREYLENQLNESLAETN